MFLGVETYFAGMSGVNRAWCIGAMTLLSGMCTSVKVVINNRMIDIVEIMDRISYPVIQSLIRFPFAFSAYFTGLAAEERFFLPVFCVNVVSVLSGLGLKMKPNKARGKIETKAEIRISA